MEKITYKEWKKKGRELFGNDPRKWKFQCPRCGHIQTMEDLANVGCETPEQTAFFSCIGRWKKGVGCDWTLGGLFHIHKVEVIMPDGTTMPSFEFEMNGGT